MFPKIMQNFRFVCFFSWRFLHFYDGEVHSSADSIRKVGMLIHSIHSASKVFNYGYFSLSETYGHRENSNGRSCAR